MSTSVSVPRQVNKEGRAGGVDSVYHLIKLVRKVELWWEREYIVLLNLF